MGEHTAHLERDLRKRPDGARLRAVLAALAHALGDGAPADVITIVAAGFGTGIGPVDALLTAAQPYITTTTDGDGTLLYRLADEEFAGHLRRHPYGPPDDSAAESAPGSAAGSAAGSVVDEAAHEAAAAAAAADDTYAADLAGLVFDRLLASASGGWGATTAYLRRHAIQHAAATGRVDRLVTDLDFVVHADPSTLVAELPRAETREAQVIAAVYQVSLALHAGADPAIRRRLLATDALRHGAPELARRLAAPVDGWRARWTAGSPVDEDAGASGGVASVACTVVGSQAVAVTAGVDGALRVWDLATGERVGEPLAGHVGGIAAVACTVVDGRAVAVTAGQDRTVRVWDLAAGQQLGEALTGHTDPVHAVACTVVDGRAVAVTGGEDWTARVWDLAAGQQLGAALTGHTDRITAIACATVDDQPVAVTGSWDRTALLWDLTAAWPTGEHLTTPGHTGGVTAVACTVVDGRAVAVTGGIDRKVRLWDLAAGRRIGNSLAGHANWIRAVACAVVDGRPVAVTGCAYEVRLWDLTDGHCLDVLPMPVPVSALAVTDDLTLTVCSDRELLVFSLSGEAHNAAGGGPQSGRA